MGITRKNYVVLLLCLLFLNGFIKASFYEPVVAPYINDECYSIQFQMIENRNLFRVSNHSGKDIWIKLLCEKISVLNGKFFLASTKSYCIPKEKFLIFLLDNPAYKIKSVHVCYNPDGMRYYDLEVDSSVNYLDISCEEKQKFEDAIFVFPKWNYGLSK